MRFCSHCGAQAADEAVICIKCGCSIEPLAAAPPKNTDSTMQTIVKIFLILGCITQGWLLLPLAWCLPLTLSVFKSFREKAPIDTSVKVCVLLFVNLIAGVCLLCADEFS